MSDLLLLFFSIFAMLLPPADNLFIKIKKKLMCGVWCMAHRHDVFPIVQYCLSIDATWFRIFFLSHFANNGGLTQKSDFSLSLLILFQRQIEKFSLKSKQRTFVGFLLQKGEKYWINLQRNEKISFFCQFEIESNKKRSKQWEK